MELELIRRIGYYCIGFIHIFVNKSIVSIKVCQEKLKNKYFEGNLELFLYLGCYVHHDYVTVMLLYVLVLFNM